MSEPDPDGEPNWNTNANSALDTFTNPHSHSYSDGNAHRHSRTNIDASIVADTAGSGQHIRQSHLLSEFRPSARCDDDSDWSFAGAELDPDQRLR